MDWKLWSRAWKLTKGELIRQRYGAVFSLFYNVYMSGMIGAIYNDMDKSPKSSTDWRIEGILLNLLMIIVVANMGFVFSKDYFSYFKNDTFTRKLRFWRSLPIDVMEIAVGRIQQMLIVCCVMAVPVFLPAYLISAPLREHLQPLNYVGFSLMWMMFGLFFGGLFLYCEYGTAGRKYFKVSVITVLAITAIAGILGGSDTNLVVETVRLIRSWSWLPLLPVGACCGCFLIFIKNSVARKLAHRDLYSG